MVNNQGIIKALNELTEKVEAANLLNTIVIGCLAAASPPFEKDLKELLEAMLSAGQGKLPGDFEKRARDILENVLEFSETDPARTPPYLRLVRKPEDRFSDS